MFVFFITSSNFRPETSLAGFWLGVALALCGVLIHELGHVTASLRYGVAQGGIGVGLYWIWPAFYADVRRTWRLAPMERAIVSAGGLYFQSIYVAALILIHAQSGSGALAFATNISMMMMLTTLNPIFKFDGYWLISDLTGNYNLHRKIASHLVGISRVGGSNRGALLKSRMTAIATNFSAFAGYYFYYLILTMMHVFETGIASIGASWSAWTTHLANSSVTGTLFSSSTASLIFTLAELALMVVGIFLLSYRCIQSVRTIIFPHRVLASAC